MNRTKIKVANAPCSWGVLEFELEGQTMRFDRVLDEIAAAGYEGTELGDWGFMPTNPTELAKEIAQRNLTLLGAFVPVSLSIEAAHAEGIERALKTAKLMYDAGFTNAFIVLADENGRVDSRTNNAGRILTEHLLEEADYRTIAKGADALAAAVKDRFGLRTVIHHHCAGYIETQQEIDWLMEFTNPSLVGLCFDTGHLMFGGGNDPMVVLEKYFNRIWHVHFKDFNPQVANQASKEGLNYFGAVSKGVFCELGKGVVPFNRVKEFLEANHYEGWIVVEQDVLPGMGSPLACAKNNRDYLLQIGL